MHSKYRTVTSASRQKFKKDDVYIFNGLQKFNKWCYSCGVCVFLDAVFIRSFKATVNALLRV